MELNICAGKRVLYKNGNSGWLVGNIMEGNAEITPLGLFIPIIPRAFLEQDQPEEIHWCKVQDLFLDATPINEYLKIYPDYYMEKDRYIEIVEQEDFDKQRENAFFSDGDYIYYPVSKYNRAWIEKQPFDYVVRGD